MGIEINQPALVYAEGSWTPTVIGSTTPGAQTYGTQAGRYVRIGNMAFLTFTVTVTATDAAWVGNVQFGGLPFACVNDTAIWGGNLSTIINLTHAATYLEFGIRISPGVSVIGLFEFGQATSGATTAVPVTAMLPGIAATTFVGTISYRVA